MVPKAGQKTLSQEMENICISMIYLTLLGTLHFKELALGQSQLESARSALMSMNQI
jgi:hypothetical protein